jgi:predicted amidohydrolase YtcJ
LVDLTILSGNPLEVKDIRELVVERTVIEGATVYSRR